MKKTIPFYGIMLATYFFDNFILIALIWSTLKEFNSTLILGLIMSISSIFPFILSKVPNFKVENSIRNIAYYKIFAYLLLIVMLFFSNNLVMFIYLGIIFGIGNFLNLSTFQAINSKLISSKYVTSNVAARIFQGSIQVGTFLGVAIGALLLNMFELKIYLFQTSIMIVITSILMILYKEEKGGNSLEIEKQHASLEKSNTNNMMWFVTVVLLGILGAHISSFNIVAPVIFQNIHNWSSAQYGLVDALAGLGAFVSIFVPKKISKNIVLFSVILIMADSVLGFSNDYNSVMIIAFVIGGVIGTISILIREMLANISLENNSIEKTANVSSLVYNICYGIAPLVVAILVDKNLLISKYVLVSIAFFMLLVSFIYNKKHKEHDLH